VGRWHPEVAAGDRITDGQVVGRLRRAGKWIAVSMPSGGAGLVVDVLAGWTRVEWGSVLVQLGESASLDDASEAEEAPDGVEVVIAPMVGTLYLQGGPGQSRYAEEGLSVERAQTLALIEVMKTLTPVKAPVAGRLVRWLVQDGDSVAQGESLAWIEV